MSSLEPFGPKGGLWEHSLTFWSTSTFLVKFTVKILPLLCCDCWNHGRSEISFSQWRKLNFNKRQNFVVPNQGRDPPDTSQRLFWVIYKQFGPAFGLRETKNGLVSTFLVKFPVIFHVRNCYFVRFLPQRRKNEAPKASQALKESLLGPETPKNGLVFTFWVIQSQISSQISCVIFLSNFTIIFDFLKLPKHAQMTFNQGRTLK